MKIGCSVLQWGLGIDEKTRYTWDGRVWNTTLKQAFEDISKLGYKGVDCSESDLVPFYSRVGDFKRMAKDSDLQFVSVWNTLLPKKLKSSERATIDPKLPMNDPGQFTKICIKEITPELIKKDFKEKVKFLDIVQRMGGECLTYGGPFMLRKDVKDKFFPLIAGLLNDLGEELKKRDMRLAYHVHLSTLIQDSGDVEKLYDHADKKLVGLCLDTAHQTAAGENLPKYISKYSDRFTHVHLKDERDGQFVELGTGRIDIEGTIRTLERIGYPYWAMVELDVPSWPAFESAKISKKYIDSVMKKGGKKAK